MPSSIVVRRDGDAWIIELEVHNGKDRVVLGKDPSLRMALRQALYVVADIAGQFIGFFQYYCSNEWKDLMMEPNNVSELRLISPRPDVDTLLDSACRGEPIYTIMTEEIE